MLPDAGCRPKDRNTHTAVPLPGESTGTARSLEAELLGGAGGQEALVAHQRTGPGESLLFPRSSRHFRGARLRSYAGFALRSDRGAVLHGLLGADQGLRSPVR